MTSPAVVDGVDIDAVAAAVRRCAAVDDLYSSKAASVASYLPGRQIRGVRVDHRTLTVQVRSRWGVPFADVAAQVRFAVRPLATGRTVDVVIADITDEPTALPLAPAALPALPAAPAGHLALPGGAPRVPGANPAVGAPPAPAAPALGMPVDVAGEPAERDGVACTTSTGDVDASSSAPTIPTVAETLPPSSPA